MGTWGSQTHSLVDRTKFTHQMFIEIRQAHSRALWVPTGWVMVKGLGSYQVMVVRMHLGRDAPVRSGRQLLTHLDWHWEQGRLPPDPRPTGSYHMSGWLSGGGRGSSEQSPQERERRAGTQCQGSHTRTAALEEWEPRKLFSEECPGQIQVPRPRTRLC